MNEKTKVALVEALKAVTAGNLAITNKKEVFEDIVAKYLAHPDWTPDGFEEDAVEYLEEQYDLLVGFEKEKAELQAEIDAIGKPEVVEPKAKKPVVEPA